MSKSDSKILVTNIQRMCFHDGPGIRTTVFLKGCNLRCPWCANPENISFERQTYEKDGHTGIYGRLYNEDELLDELMKDRVFYGKDGGITFSGGEPLLHLEKLKDVLYKLRKEGISIAVETALQVPKEIWYPFINMIDLYIVDVKILLPDKCKEILGGDINIYYENINQLCGNEKNILFRLPINKEFTFQTENAEAIMSFLSQHKDIPIEIFATHMLGEIKYQSLNKESIPIEAVSGMELENIAILIRKQGCQVNINSI
ncbi:MAG: radical SAM protein [Lachnospiraceae bacterium]|nr:radical SAM protein [Lachnospiraceae bacterium]